MTKHILVATLLVFCLAISPSAYGQFRTVALNGQASPGLPGVFSSFSPPVLNDHGQAAFVASTATAAGIWSEGSGSLAVVARNDQSAPGGVNFTTFRRIVLNNAGQLAIEAQFSGGTAPNTTGYGFWSAGIGGPLNLVARQGGPAPGHPGGAVIDAILNSLNGFVAPPVLNDAGQFTFRALLRGPGINGTTNNDKGLWWNIGGSVTPMIFTRDTTTGVANGLDYIGIGEPLINNHGQVAFAGYMAPSGGVNGPRLADPNGTVTPIALTTEGFQNLILPARINDAGDVAFWTIENNGVQALWRKFHGGPRFEVITVGSQAPGAPAGVTFSHLTSPILNGQGRMAFGGNLQGPGVTTDNDFGIYAERNSGPMLIAREGDAAPGTNLVFKTFDPSITHNRVGQVAFSAAVGPAIGPSIPTTGIWATDIAGQLKVLAYPGMQIDVDNVPGQDLRTISSVTPLITDLGGTGNEDGLASAFNEFGQLAFTAAFTDGSRGVFVTNAVAVPEPSTVGMCLMVALASLSRRPSAPSSRPGRGHRK